MVEYNKNKILRELGDYTVDIPLAGKNGSETDSNLPNSSCELRLKHRKRKEIDEGR